MANVEIPIHEPVGERSLKKVIRRKASVLEKVIKITDATLEEMVKSKALQEDGLDALMKLRGGDRMAHIVEYLDMESEGGRSHFLDFIKSQSPWLHEEIMVEIYAESGSLPIDEAEVQDASFLVHRHFGTSRRFSEQDKRVMTSLVATKAQVTKEVWSRRLSVSERELQVLRKEIEEREKLIRSTNETIKTFVKRNEMGLLDFTEAKSTSEILRRCTKDRKSEELINELVKRTHFVLQRFGMILMDRHGLTEQKQECLNILKTQDGRTPLHMLIRDTIRHLLEENKASFAQVKSLRHKVVNLEEQLNNRELEVERLQAEIKELRSRSQQGSRQGSRQGSPVTKGISSTMSAVDAEWQGSGLLVGDIGSSVSPLSVRRIFLDSALDEADASPTRKPAEAVANKKLDRRREGMLQQSQSQHQKACGSHSLPPISKTKNTAMWPNAKAGKAKQCLLDV